MLHTRALMIQAVATADIESQTTELLPQLPPQVGGWSNCQAAHALSRTPNAPTIFITVSKLGLPSLAIALYSPWRERPVSLASFRHAAARSSDDTERMHQRFMVNAILK